MAFINHILRGRVPEIRGDLFTSRRVPGQDTITLYVHHTGSVNNDGLASTRPLPTLEMALALLSSFSWGRLFLIKVLNGHAETLTRPLHFPPIIGTGDPDDLAFDASFNYSGVDPTWDLLRTPLRIECDPVLVDTFTGVVTTYNAVTGMTTVTDATKAWTVNEHVGRIVLAGGSTSVSNPPSTYGVVFSNTATALNITATTDLGMTNGPMRIVSRGATFTLGDSTSWTKVGLFLNACMIPVSFVGITFARGSGVTGPLFNITSHSNINFLMCEFNGGITFNPGAGLIAIDGSYLHSGFWGANGQALALRGSLMSGMSHAFHGTGGSGLYDFYGNYITGCGPLGHGGTSTPEGAFRYDHCHIVAGTGVGVKYTGSGARCNISNTKIDSCAAGGIAADGPGYLLLNNVTGISNTGYGITVDSGTHVVATSTDLTGSSGAIHFAGAGTNAWADLPLVSSTRLCRMGTT